MNVRGQWNGDAAAAMYTGPLKQCLEQEYPKVKGAWRVMDDNDPAGYSSYKGWGAKAEAGIVSFKLPPRSPDLNPLDFSVWSEINRRTRKQESTWPAGKTETRREYLRRLKRTALVLPEDYIRKVVGDTRGRCRLIVKAKGGHIVEGGGSAASA